MELEPSYTGNCPHCGNTGKRCEATAVVGIGLKVSVSVSAERSETVFVWFNKKVGLTTGFILIDIAFLLFSTTVGYVVGGLGPFAGALVAFLVGLVAIFCYNLYLRNRIENTKRKVMTSLSGGDAGPTVKNKKNHEKVAGTHRKEQMWGFIVEGLIIFLLTFALTTLFSPIPRLYDQLWSPHPDTHIYQPFLSGEGPVILITNNGRAIDRLRIEIHLHDLNDRILDLHLSENRTFTLLGGGPGSNYATFVIEELWPQTTQYVELIASSPTKVAADVKAWSLSKENVEEEIPVVQVK